MERLMILGILLIAIGFVFMLLSALKQTNLEKERINGNKDEGKVDVAVGGFIGPIPFGFFTSRNMFWAWLSIVVIGAVLWFLSRRGL